MFKHIVVAVDASPSSDNAVEMAVGLAKTDISMVVYVNRLASFQMAPLWDDLDRFWDFK